MLAQHTHKDTEALSERRTRMRSRSLKQVKILTHDKKSVYDAVLKNVTAYGAALNVGLSERLPQNFNLHFVYDDVTVPCEVKWRRLGSVGVVF